MNKTLLIVLVILNGCTSKQEKRDSENQKNFGCVDVDDCLAKYKFSEAMSLAYRPLSIYEFQKDDDIRRIISTGVAFYVANKSIEKALQSLSEYNFQYSFRYVDDFGGPYNKNENYNSEISWYNSNIEKIVSSFRINGDNEKAKSVINIYYKPKAVRLKLISKFDGAGEAKDYDKWSYKLDDSEKEKLLKAIK